MKKLLSAVVVLLLAGLSGCATPGYTAGWPDAQFVTRPATGENAFRYMRAAQFDFEQMTDDINLIMLLDTPSHLSKWNLR